MLWVAILAPFAIALVVWLLPRPLGPGDALPPQLDGKAHLSRATPRGVVFELRVTNLGREPLHVLGFTVAQAAIHGRHVDEVPRLPATLDGADAAGRVPADLWIAPCPEDDVRGTAATLGGRLTVTSDRVNMLTFTVFAPHVLRGRPRDAVTLTISLRAEGSPRAAVETWLAGTLKGP